MTAQAIEPPGGWNKLLEEATREVFDVMLKTPLDPVASATGDAELIAMVGLSGRVAGVVSVHCTAAGAREIATKMLQGPLAEEEAEDTARDAVGEVCNMVAGNFKTRLGTAGDDCKLSVPTIIAGAACSMTPQNQGVHVEVPFQFSGSPLRIVLDLPG
jgi:chemotaxis protein CheX